jgi:hypothetical protein
MFHEQPIDDLTADHMSGLDRAFPQDPEYLGGAPTCMNVRSGK